MKIFVGNLSRQTTEDDLRQAFESFGQVRSVTIVMDAAAGKSRGFGFVIMPSAKEVRNAIENLNGKDLRGEKIKVEKGRTQTKARASRRKQSRLEGRGPTKAGRKGRAGKRRGKRRH